jgi:hypothetical protein
VRLIDETYVRRVLADAAAALPSSLDMVLALREARDELLRRLGGRMRAHSHARCRPLAAPVRAASSGCCAGTSSARTIESSDRRMGEEVSAMLRGHHREQVPADKAQTGDVAKAKSGGYSEREARAVSAQYASRMLDQFATRTLRLVTSERANPGGGGFRKPSVYRVEPGNEPDSGLAGLFFVDCYATEKAP